MTPTFSPQVDHLTPLRYVPMILDFDVWKIEPLFAIAILCLRASREIV